MHEHDLVSALERALRNSHTLILLNVGDLRLFT